MKRTLAYLLLLAAVVAAGGCSRAKTIPNRDLKEIFKEAFLINAYYQTNPALIMADSLDIYNPILKKHGYTLRDLENTVQNITKQKSQSLSHIVEMAIGELLDESRYLDDRVAALDTVDARASRMFAREVLYEPNITVKTVKDTARLRITLPVEEGSYVVSFSYLLDSLDLNRGLRMTGTVRDTLGRIRNIPPATVGGFERKRIAPHRIETTAADTSLVLVLVAYPKDVKNPNLSIDSLRIVRYLTKEKASDSLSKLMFHPNFPPYAQHDPVAQDSSALCPDPIGVDSVGSGDDRR